MLELLDLPSEILAHVAGFCPPSLKDLRLTNSRICQISTPALFRSVTIVPHATSFENLLSVSQSALAHHVHDIVYDVRVLSSIPDIRMAFEANEFSLVGTDIDVSRKKIFSLLDEYEKQAFTSVESTELEIRHMLHIFPTLPNLGHITVISGSLCELPYFYQKLKDSLFITSDYYFETSNHSGHHARSVLLSLGAIGLKISCLTSVGIDWSEIVRGSELRAPPRYWAMLQRVFRTLPKEKLSAPVSWFLYANENVYGDPLVDLLAICATALHQIEHLKLSLATSRSERQLFLPTGPSWPLSSASLCGSLHSVIHACSSNGQTGPRSLKSLELSSMVFKEADLDFILSGCRNTLVNLALGDLRLYTGYDNVSIHGTVGVEESCWVSILEGIQKHLPHLKTVKLFGRFYNGGSQDWIVNARHKGSLRNDVEHWLTNGGRCPLDSERLMGGFQGTRAGDDSFRIFRRTLEDITDDEVEYDFPPTSENELLLGA